MKGRCAMSDDTAETAKKWAALIVAAVALIAYAVLVAVAWDKAGDEAEAWARRLALLGGIEALAFAAAGWLWGKEVSRQVITQADSRVADAQRGAEQALADAQQGRANAVAAAQSLALLSSATTPNVARGVWTSSDELAQAILAMYGVAGSARN